MSKGTLHLIPNLLNGDQIDILPKTAIEAAHQLDTFIVENEKYARRFLIKIGIPTAIDDLTFLVQDKHNPKQDYLPFLMPLLEGKNIGLLSDAGCPAVADPGSKIVKIAHEMQIPIMPHVGPSSILLALMGSGFNGQEFAFNGYLPIDRGEKNRRIKWLDKQVQQFGSTQIFIETPYRNVKLLETLIQQCPKSRLLCIATDLTLPSQKILTKTMAEWKQQLPDIHKRPTVFLIGK